MNASVSACFYRYFKQSRLNLTETGQIYTFLKLPLVTLSFKFQHKQWDVRCYSKSLGWLALTYACSSSPVSEVPRLLRPLHMSPVTETNFALGWRRNFSPVSEMGSRPMILGTSFGSKGQTKQTCKRTQSWGLSSQNRMATWKFIHWPTLPRTNIRFCLTRKNFTALLRSGLSNERFYGSSTISYKIQLIINMTLLSMIVILY